MSKRKVQILNEVYSKGDNKTNRIEFEIIASMVEYNSSVLDLGCGDGTLGEKLIKERNCKVVGVDISEVAVKYAQRKGVNAIVGDLDEPLNFDDNTYVILCDVLEHLFDPMFALKEALRVSKKYVIVAFPNFAYLPARFELLFMGRFPRYPLFGYKWYNTQHIRLFSYKDFKEVLKELNFNIKVVYEKHVCSRKIPEILSRLFPNLFAIVCIMKIDKYKFNPNSIREYKYDV